MRAARFGAHDAIVREVCARMLGRLSYMRLPVTRLLDLGCGPGASRGALQRQFADAQWLGIDLSPAMLRAPVRAHGWPQRLGRWLARGDSAPRICASAEALPLADASIDLVFSNLMLHWHPAPHEVIAEVARVLRTGGLLIFSSFGPDTWKELRAACQATLPDVRPMPFVDMHDFGDMLVAAGFDSPVMEADVLHLTFGDARTLLAEARALGGNPRADRARTLVSGVRARSLLRTLQGAGDAQGRVGLSFEIVIGHGWKAPPRTAGVSTIAMPRPYRR